MKHFQIRYKHKNGNTSYYYFTAKDNYSLDEIKSIAESKINDEAKTWRKLTRTLQVVEFDPKTGGTVAKRGGIKFKLIFKFFEMVSTEGHKRTIQGYMAER